MKVHTKFGLYDMRPPNYIQSLSTEKGAES